MPWPITGAAVEEEEEAEEGEGEMLLAFGLAR
jgi:hypothetical protein